MQGIYKDSGRGGEKFSGVKVESKKSLCVSELGHVSPHLMVMLVTDSALGPFYVTLEKKKQFLLHM
jgi:hypothetical protein